MSSVSQDTMFITQPKLTFLSETATENNNKLPDMQDKTTVNEVWTKNNFNSRKVKQKLELNLNSSAKMSWTDEKADSDKSDDKIETDSPQTSPPIASPTKDDNSHHARRPMNAFLIFCKKHRSVVKEKYPNSENRAVTRILGEWWAQLNSVDKAPYTNLAKEYKDAFFSANPDFKWYKLPAPPLRTLNTRPTSVPKPSSPILTNPINTTSPRPEFTPGKLADESQLGSLTSLMNMNTTFNNNNNNNNYSKNTADESHVHDLSPKTPLNLIKDSLKPIKKRLFVDVDTSDASENVFSFETNAHTVQDESYERNMTKQELLNKVVDSLFDTNDNYKGEKRKSERTCKGKRYEQFMVENKLLSSKRQFLDMNKKFDCMEGFNKSESTTPKLDLENTIKRLAERTHFKMDEAEAKAKERTRSISETSDDLKNVQSSFNLDLRISNLPSLSYEHYLQKKRESKKRKIRTKSESSESKVERSVTSAVPIGSKKRKNKQSITHLEKVPDADFGGDLSGLATLAEIAAITEKINEK